MGLKPSFQLCGHDLKVHIFLYIEHDRDLRLLSFCAMTELTKRVKNLLMFSVKDVLGLVYLNIFEDRLFNIAS